MTGSGLNRDYLWCAELSRDTTCTGGGLSVVCVAGIGRQCYSGSLRHECIYFANTVVTYRLIVTTGDTAGGGVWVCVRTCVRII